MAGEGARVGTDGQKREMRELAAHLQGASLGDISASPTVEMADLATSSRGAPRGTAAAGRSRYSDKAERRELLVSGMYLGSSYLPSTTQHSARDGIRL